MSILTITLNGGEAKNTEIYTDVSGAVVRIVSSFRSGYVSIHQPKDLNLLDGLGIELNFSLLEIEDQDLEDCDGTDLEFENCPQDLKMKIERELSEGGSPPSVLETVGFEYEDSILIITGSVSIDT